MRHKRNYGRLTAKLIPGMSPSDTIPSQGKCPLCGKIITKTEIVIRKHVGSHIQNKETNMGKESDVLKSAIFHS